MQHGIYTCVILMAFLALSESVYAAIPVLTVASDTIRRVVIYFDKEETDIDFIRKEILKMIYKTKDIELDYSKISAPHIDYVPKLKLFA